MPPEMLKTNGKYNEKADIWQAGITMYKILFDEYPYQNLDEIKNGQERLFTKI